MLNKSGDFSGLTFKAAVLVSHNEPLEIIELKYPTIGPNQLLIKIKYSGICRSQLMEVSGSRGLDKWIPHTLGHEAVGVIQEIGSQISRFEVGEKVILSWVAEKNISTSGYVYESTDGRKINSGPISTFSEMAVIDESRVHKIQGNFSDEILCLFGCALITGSGMSIAHFDPAKHKRVLVLGFGGIGSAAAIALDVFKDTEITVIDASLERVELAKALGFKNSFLATSLNDVNSQIKLSPFDLCLESGGTAASIELGFSLISSDGTLVFASHPPTGDKISIDPYELIEGKKIVGTWGGDLDAKSAIEIVSEHLSKSKLPLKLLVGEHFPLLKINDALDYLSESKSGRAILDCENQL
jgi:S-(hydroxymethyl)glutathione dehydrogenase/alcohol dehydrogenase